MVLIPDGGGIKKPTSTGTSGGPSTGITPPASETGEDATPTSGSTTTSFGDDVNRFLDRDLRFALLLRRRRFGDDIPEPVTGSTPPSHDSSTTPGLSQNQLRSGNHKGKRDENIEQLQDDRDKLKKADGAKSIVQTVSNFLPGVGLIAKIAAQPVIERVTGVNLDDVDKQVEQIEQQLNTNTVLNFLANAAYAVGGDEGKQTAEVLDGGRSIQIVTNAKLKSDAAYITGTGTIQVTQKMIDRAQADMQALQRQGIVGANGEIKDAAKFDASTTADSAIKTANLIGTHEETHAQQDASGAISASNAIIRQMAHSFAAEASDLVGSRLERFIADSERYLELYRIRKQELSAYQTQETAQFRSGASTRTQLTIDAKGVLLPTVEAVANIYQFQLDMPLMYGPDGDLDAAQAALDEHLESRVAAFAARIASVTDPVSTPPAGGRIPADYLGGGRIPGGRIPAFSLAATFLNGGRIPGDDVNGGRIPGGRIPADLISGLILSGGRIPGDDLGGGRIPGLSLTAWLLSGGRIPGEDIDGGRIPGKGFDRNVGYFDRYATNESASFSLSHAASCTRDRTSTLP